MGELVEGPRVNGPRSRAGSERAADGAAAGSWRPASVGKRRCERSRQCGERRGARGAGGALAGLGAGVGAGGGAWRGARGACDARGRPCYEAGFRAHRRTLIHHEPTGSPGPRFGPLFGPFGAFSGPSLPSGRHPQAKFIAAIKGYDWEAAAQHAQTQQVTTSDRRLIAARSPCDDGLIAARSPRDDGLIAARSPCDDGMMARRQDLDDIKDSRSRVEHMHYHMHMGNKAQARDEMAPSFEI